MNGWNSFWRLPEQGLLVVWTQVEDKEECPSFPGFQLERLGGCTAAQGDARSRRERPGEEASLAVEAEPGSMAGAAAAEDLESVSAGALTSCRRA